MCSQISIDHAPSFTQHEIRALFKSAKRILKHTGLDILLAPASYQKGRLLVVTPKRIGNAPQRNKIRRRLKAIFHESLLSQCKFDCMIIIKKDGTNLPFDILQSLVVSAFQKAQSYEQSPR